MQHEDLVEAMRASLADGRVSRGERRALRELLDEANPGGHERTLLRGAAFRLAREALGGPRVGDVLEWLEDVLGILAQPPGGGDVAPAQAEAWFSPGTEPLKAIVEAMRSARSTVDVCVFTITDDRISDGLLALARRGVQVRIVSDDGKEGDRGSDLGRLARAGIPVAVDRSEAHMHHKFAIFDGARLLTGSFNWTRAASGENHENLLVTSDPRLVQAYQGEFDRLWSRYV